MQTFEEYAYYYNMFYGDKDYIAEARDINFLIKKYAQLDGKRLLNLGCGTGKHDSELHKLGYEVKGIDLSPNMIDIAQKDYLEEGLEFECGDIRDYRDDKKYDICTSLFHVISYQNSNQDLVSAFNTAYDELMNNGIFIFDVWYGPGVLTEKPEIRIKRVGDEKRTFIRHAVPVLYAEDNLVDVNYEVLIIDNATDKVQKLNETHRMRYLFTPEVKFYLEQCGFELLACLDCNTLSSVSLNSWTAYFIARKVGK